MSNWENMDQWEVVLPPSRPTTTELNRIENYIKEYDRGEPVAILGSTPEFRELLDRLGFNNRFIFDKSIEFYSRMSNLLPNGLENREHFVIGDWLETLHQYSNYFQVILSDLTMGNIAYTNRGAFYNHIAGAVKEGGTFIDKVLAFDFNPPKLEKLFEKYERLPINLRTVNDFSSEVLFCSELVTHDKIVDSTKFYQYIESGDFSDKIKFFSKLAHMITPKGFIWHYGIPWQELSEVYGSFYKQQIVYVEEEKESPYYKRTKQFFNIK